MAAKLISQLKSVSRRKISPETLTQENTVRYNGNGNIQSRTSAVMEYTGSRLYNFTKGIS